MWHGVPHWQYRVRGASYGRAARPQGKSLANSLAPAMKADLGLNNAQMGRAFSAFTFADALREAPSGRLALDSTKRLLWP
jgi:hypothetical protein